MEKFMTPQGMWRDTLIGQNNRIVYDSGWVSNTIVDKCRSFLAGLMKSDSSAGIRFLAVGQGAAAWDTSGPPAPDPTASDLIKRYSPTILIKPADMVYLDAANNPIGQPTNRLQITVTLVPGYPAPIAPLATFPLREFGLFGNFGGADYMINSVRHPVIHKDEAATLVRVVRLVF
jgi:hypothetical protein